jgi:hypothetical protein
MVANTNPDLNKDTDSGLELSKNERLYNWLRFFNAETKEELEMVAQTSPAIKKAVDIVMELSKDEHVRMLYEAEMKARDSRTC